MLSDDFDRQNLFVKYLPNGVTDEDLYNLFAPFGEIVSSKVMIDNKTGESLGYGFVKFANLGESERALAALNNFRLGNKILLVKPSNAQRELDMQKSTNLYVKPLLPNTTEQMLRSIFQPYGKIEGIRVMVDKHTRSSKQIGFVRFSTQEEADAAIAGVSGYKLDPIHPPLSFLIK
ncbi:MAG: putative CBN-EXC-7 protein [Streblomastix strix]|uniref:Putative CBN-EXC-7 protein n=1 Tax=Streblomastix strix TaxID=222440 RepID=A0A5J4XB78_9EUKA|nr:MAG: putative CBN-EXC-7 protein [Streblomastix strix]